MHHLFPIKSEKGQGGERGTKTKTEDESRGEGDRAAENDCEDERQTETEQRQTDTGHSSWLIGELVRMKDRAKDFNRMWPRYSQTSLGPRFVHVLHQHPSTRD